MRFPASPAVRCFTFLVLFAGGQAQLDFLIGSNPSLQPGQSCQAAGREGKCTEFRFCPTEARKFLGLNCGLINGKFFVCCPDISKSADLTTSRTVSAPLANFQCGNRGEIPIFFGFSRTRRSSFLPNLEASKLPGENEVAVVGGIESVANSWPWMILLGRKQGPRTQFFCSAVLINNRYALTAAHCILDPAPFFARLGEHDHRQNAGLSITAENIDVNDVIIHPKYEINKGYNDIAILKLARPVNFRKEIRPVCLPWGTLANERLVNKKVTITGWGSEQFGRGGSPVLREVKVDVLDPAICQASYSSLSEFRNVFPDGMNEENIVCAGNILGGKDSCQGDSGGPIVHQGKEGSYYLAGIISKGYGCGKEGFPGLYAPIRSYETLQWIKRVAF